MSNKFNKKDYLNSAKRPGPRGHGYGPGKGVVPSKVEVPEDEVVAEDSALAAAEALAEGAEEVKDFVDHVPDGTAGVDETYDDTPVTDVQSVIDLVDEAEMNLTELGEGEKEVVSPGGDMFERPQSLGSIDGVK